MGSNFNKIIKQITTNTEWDLDQTLNFDMNTNVTVQKPELYYTNCLLMHYTIHHFQGKHIRYLVPSFVYDSVKKCIVICSPE